MRGAGSFSRGFGKRGWLTLGLSVLALWTGWQALSLGAAQTLARKEPEEALKWRAGFAPALARRAESLALSPAPEDYRQAYDPARRALIASPLEARALRVLGLLVARDKGERAAEPLMELAARRSLRDPAAHIWLFERRLEQRDWKRALFHADVLMRKPSPSYNATAVVVSAAFEPDAVDELIKRMTPEPRWRRDVITRIARFSPSYALELSLRLVQAGSVLQDKEVAAVVRPMISNGAYANAYVAWAQLLPASANDKLGDVYDRGFDGAPGIPPFNWALSSKPEGGAELASGPSGEGRSLYVRHSARKPMHFAEQVLLLPPGQYRLKARGYVEEPGRGEELRWRLACHRGERLGEIAAPNETMRWIETGALVEVPAQGCDVQRLALVAQPGIEHTGTLHAWFDDVDVQRVR